MDKFKIPPIPPSGSLPLTTGSLPSITGNLSSLTSSFSSVLGDIDTLSGVSFFNRLENFNSIIGKPNIPQIKTPKQINEETEKLISKKNNIQDQLNIVKSIFKK